MNVSQEGIDLIKSFEGCKLEAYPDPGTGGAPWTIGWGTTAGVVEGMTITQEQADQMLADDVAKVAGQVNSLLKIKVNQNQFDSLVSFAYNAGAGALASSTLLRLVNAGDFGGAADQFPRWVHGGGGGTLPGLVRRRAAERSLFMMEPL